MRDSKNRESFFFTSEQAMEKRVRSDDKPCRVYTPERWDHTDCGEDTCNQVGLCDFHAGGCYLCDDETEDEDGG